MNTDPIDSGFDEPLTDEQLQRLSNETGLPVTDEQGRTVIRPTSTIESEQFDAQWLHNFGPDNPTPIGAVAKCGAVSKSHRAGEIEPLRVECCPICLALTEIKL